jgi:coenzyme F420-0:L-glutamate ligase/coenzyme F420-1:gamma-L-glutamate ligase
LHEFYEFIATRRSIRKFKKDPVSIDKLTRIVEVGKWAPSAHNAQPWQFFIFQNRVAKEKLAKAMGEAFHQDLEADGENPKLIETLVQESVERFSSAPVLILACLTMELMDSYPDKKRKAAEVVMAVQSVAVAVHTILLAAYAEGLGACWFCAPLFCPDAVRRTLGLSDELIPQALIAVGIADEAPDPPLRYPIEKFVTFVDERVMS